MYKRKKLNAIPVFETNQKQGKGKKCTKVNKMRKSRIFHFYGRRFDVIVNFGLGFDVCIFGTLFGLLMKPPHMATQRIFVAEHFVAKFASDEVGLGFVHISDMPGQSVPR